MSYDFRPGVILSVYGDITPSGPRLALATKITYPRHMGDVFLFKYPFITSNIGNDTAQRTKYLYKDVLARITRSEDFRKYQRNETLMLRSETLRTSGYYPDGTTQPQWGDFLRIVMPAPFSPEPLMPRSAGPNAIPYDQFALRVLAAELQEDSTSSVYAGNYFRRARAPNEWERGLQKIASVSFTPDAVGFPGGYTEVSLLDLSEPVNVETWVFDANRFFLVGSPAISALGGGSLASLRASTPWRLTMPTQPAQGTAFHDGLSPGKIEIFSPEAPGTIQATVNGVNGITNNGLGADHFTLNSLMTRDGEYFLASDVVAGNPFSLRIKSGTKAGDYPIIGVEDPAGSGYLTAVLDVAPIIGPLAPIGALVGNVITAAVPGAFADVWANDTVTISGGVPADNGCYRVIAAGPTDLSVQELDGTVTAFTGPAGAAVCVVHRGALNDTEENVEWEIVNQQGAPLLEPVEYSTKPLGVYHYVNETEIIVEPFVPLGPWRGTLQCIWSAQAWTNAQSPFAATDLVDVLGTETDVIRLPVAHNETMFFRKNMIANTIFIEGELSETGDAVPVSDAANGMYRVLSLDVAPTATVLTNLAYVVDTNQFDTTAVVAALYESDVGTLIQVGAGPSFTYYRIVEVDDAANLVYVMNTDGSLPIFLAGAPVLPVQVIEDRFTEATLGADFAQTVRDANGDPANLPDCPWRYIPTVPANWVVQAPLFDWNARTIEVNRATETDGEFMIPSISIAAFKAYPLIEERVYVVDFPIDADSFEEEDFINTGRFRLVPPTVGQILPGSFRGAYGVLCRGTSDDPLAILAYPIAIDDYARTYGVWTKETGTGSLLNTAPGVYTFARTPGGLAFTADLANAFILEITTPGLTKGIYLVSAFGGVDTLTVSFLGSPAPTFVGTATTLDWGIYPLPDAAAGTTQLRVMGADLQSLREPDPQSEIFKSDDYFRQDFYIDTFTTIEEALNAREALKRELNALFSTFGDELSEFVILDAISYGQVGEGLQEVFFTP